MKTEKKCVAEMLQSTLSSVANRARSLTRRYAQPVLSGFLALTMVVGSVPTPAYAQMMDDATRALAPIVQGMASSDEEAESTADSNATTTDDAPALLAEDESAQQGEDAAAGDNASQAQGEQESAPAEDAAVKDSESNNAAPANGTDAAASNSNASKTDSAATENEKGDASTALFSTNNDLTAVTAGGEALASQAAAAQALKDSGADDASARQMSETLFAVPRRGESPLKKNGSSLPSEADGSKIDQISTVWMTSDTTDNKNADLLYVKPNDDARVNVSMRVSYGLSGEHDYPAGSIVITIPASIFTTRDGKGMGSMRLSVPQEPSTRMEWNYKFVGDKYLITNTRTLPASTKGYMEFAIEGLRPFDLVDMKTSAPFDPSIEVTTNAGNLIGKKSNELTAQFDTRAKITGATKKASEEPRIVDSSYIPADQRIKGEERYLVVTWYMNGYVPHGVNQKYTLSLIDKKNDDYKGFIIGKSTGDGVESSLTQKLNDGKLMAGVGNTEFTTVEVAYPMSQFKKEQTYTLKNKVTYTLTEADPEVAGDKQEVTTKEATASVEWKYSDPEFDPVDGDVELYAYGTHPLTGDAMDTLTPSGQSVGSDLASVWDPGCSPFNGYYGRYPVALNDIQDGKDPVVSYTLNSVAHVLPWTYKEVQRPEGSGNAEGMLGNYGQVPVTLTTEDEGLSLNDTGAGAVYDHSLKAGVDFEYAYVEFPEQPHIKKARAINLDENGNSTAKPGEYSGIAYDIDDNAANVPDITLQVKRNGKWQDHVVASWKTGELKFTGEGTPEPGATRVAIPADTESVRTVVSTKNAALLYHVRVFAKLLHNGAFGREVEKAFEGSDTPHMSVWNYAKIDAEGTNRNGEPIQMETLRKRGHDMLQGYTTDTRAQMSAKATSRISDIDPEARRVKILYNSKMEYKSHIASLATYEDALADGRLLAQEGCTWYSLLPKGFMPQLDTVKLRKDDKIREMYTIEDYRGTGRTLFVVSADLAPHPVKYNQDGVVLYEDVPTLDFSAVASFESVRDNGLDTHAVMAYQSDNESLGSVEDYRGEEDNPRGTNNKGTKAAFQTDAELDAMTDLDPDVADPVFVYAGATAKLPDALDAETSEISKLVMVNNDGVWSDGSDDAYNSRKAYVGAPYTYRLSLTNIEEGSATSGLVFYDSLENYNAGASAWHGVLTGVDTSQLEKAGCDPKVYYSTQEGLKFEKGDPEAGGAVDANKESLNLENTKIWQPLTKDTDLATVKAIAVDASKASDGSDFRLDKGETATVYVNMRAPQCEQVETENLIANDAHAYNMMYVSRTSSATGAGDSKPEVSRSGHTMVGLKEYSLSVEKTWADNKDQDNMRPNEVKLTLLANGKPADEAGVVDAGKATLTLIANEKGEWKGTFGTLPAYAKDGSKIVYSIQEDVPAGYKANIHLNGEHASIENYHEIEKVTVKGTKTWGGDNAELRPDSIKVDLYRNGKRIDSRTVRPNSVGMWTYEFRGLNKYFNGKLAEYTVKEDMAANSSYASTVNGTDIHNEYHPYGDLVISKEVKGASTVEENQEFEFAVEFSREVAQDGDSDTPQFEPVLDEFAYTVYEGNQQVGTGKVATNGVIKLQDGQRAVIDDIDEGVTYSVTEREVAGFTANDAEQTGTIEPNKTAEAAFVNTYEATATVNLVALKALAGAELQKGLFTFELVDEGAGTVIRTAQNQAQNYHEEDDEGIVGETAPVEFGAITFTQADHGRTFNYLIRENNTGIDGYTYSEDTYKVSVTVTDKGNGTLDTQVAYSTADGAPIEDPLELEGGVVFFNSYEATAKLDLQAFKKLAGGDLQDHQFTFELGKVSVAKDGTASYKKISEATNKADGTIKFAPVEFTQKDAGSTRYVVMHEVPGNDAAITYDSHYALVKVDVKDNRDGTLSLSTQMSGFEVPCWDHADKNCTICGGDKQVKAEKDAQVFKNAYKDGSLTVQKTVQGDGDPDHPDQLFDFRVELTNEEGQPVKVDPEDIKINQISDPASALTPEEAAADESKATAGEKEATQSPISWLMDRGREAWDALVGLFTPEEAHAAPAPSLPASGTSSDGNWHWKIDINGRLTIGGTGICSDTGLAAYGDSVTTVEFEANSKAARFTNLFSHWSKLESVDFTNLDTSEVVHAGGMFSDCPSLTEVDFSKCDLGNLQVTNYMFQYCGSLQNVLFPKGVGSVSGLQFIDHMFQDCAKLRSIDLSGISMNEAQNMQSMFAGCKKLEEIKLPAADDWAVTSMNGMFDGCSSLVSLDLSRFGLKNVIDMFGMFSGCSSLASVEFPTDASDSVASVDRMFKDCKSLNSIDLSGFGLSKVKYMGMMFESCSSLTEVKLPKTEHSAVTSTVGMFSGCDSLSTVNMSDFDLSMVQDMNDMFSDCKSLTSVSLRGEAPAGTRSMERTFLNCGSLQKVDLSSLDLSTVTNMIRMFESCVALESVTFPRNGSSSVTNMAQMFSGCRTLKTIDLSMFDLRAVTTMS
ncbi:MAG: BspA family leucine-rich repeat surface protein [Coriobacteriaceae bacterium]|nr:BspA family leucine-rich repeat surface protein [Coriobacteriaceae bacterium]